MSTRYISVQAVPGRFLAIHHPSMMRRYFMYEDELEALKQQWHIDIVIGDDLLKVEPRPAA